MTIAVLAIPAMLAALACLVHFKFPAVFTAIKSGFFHPGLDPGIPAYGIWNIVPLAILPFAALGIWAAARSKL